MKAKRIAQLLLEQTPDDVLMMSRRNMHISGLDSIVLAKRLDGRLIRMYVCRTNVLESNGLYGHPLVLGIHDHRYSLCLHYIHGVVRNIVFRAFGAGEAQSRLLDEYSFSPFNSATGPAVDYKGRALVTPIDWVSLSDLNPTVSMPHFRLHTVQVKFDSAWMVEETQLYPQKTTMLYTEGAPKLGDDLYQEFSNPREVRESALWWLNRDA